MNREPEGLTSFLVEELRLGNVAPSPFRWTRHGEAEDT